MRPLILASASPRRSDLLTEAGVAFEILPANIPEESLPGELPSALASRLASEKASSVARRLHGEPSRWVLGADTIVVHDGDVLGKPEDAEHAVELLTRLLGSPHHVITGFALIHSGDLTSIVRHVRSEVVMRTASRDEIRDYVATGEPLDKAGAYALQGRGQRFVESVDGSRSNVIGLPLEELLDALKSLGIESRAPIAEGAKP